MPPRDKTGCIYDGFSSYRSKALRTSARNKYHQLAPGASVLKSRSKDKTLTGLPPNPEIT